MRTLFSTLFSIILLGAFSSKVSDDVTCTLTSDKKVYKIGELPKLKVLISNNSKTDFYLIGSLDGSDAKWRFPKCYYTIDGPKGKNIESARCGNMNTLRLKDFKLVKAGENFDPYENLDDNGFFSDYITTNEESFKKPGVYKIRFFYSTISNKLKEYYGDINSRKNQDSIKIDSLFKQVPKIEILSNQIEITFKN